MVGGDGRVMLADVGKQVCIGIPDAGVPRGSDACRRKAPPRDGKVALCTCCKAGYHHGIGMRLRSF